MTQLSNEDAMKDLEGIQGVLEKHLGVGVFSTDEVLPMERITTGLTVVDYILGGGLPRGMFTETFGQESTGKTTFYTQVAAANQKLDPNFRTLFLDFEQSFDKKYAVNGLGLDITKPRFILAQPNTIEEGTIIARTLITRGLVDMVIWDTPGASQPAALVNTPLSEKDLREGYRDIEAGKSDTGTIGLHARVFTHALASLAPVVAEHNVVFCFPNQTRTTINTYGAGETTPGGKAPKFYCAIRIRLSKSATTKESITDPFFATKTATAVENVVQFHSIKNKTAPPFRIAKVRLAYGRGFLEKETLFDLAVHRKIILKAGGGNFTLPGGKQLRGTQAVIDFYDENPEEYEKLKVSLLATQLTDEELEAAVDDEDVDELPEGEVKF